MEVDTYILTPDKKNIRSQTSGNAYPASHVLATLELGNKRLRDNKRELILRSWAANILP